MTQNFSKSAWEKACTFINVFILFTNAAALVKVCFYLILRILLLMEKLSHKLGKCSITDLTKIDLVLCLVTTGKWGPVNTQSKLMVHHLKGDQGISRFKKKKMAIEKHVLWRLGQKISEVSLKLFIDFIVSATIYKTSVVWGYRTPCPSLGDTGSFCLAKELLLDWDLISSWKRREITFKNECALPLVTPVLLHCFYTCSFTLKFRMSIIARNLTLKCQWW